MTDKPLNENWVMERRNVPSQFVGMDFRSRSSWQLRQMHITSTSSGAPVMTTNPPRRRFIEKCAFKFPERDLCQDDGSGSMMRHSHEASDDVGWVSCSLMIPDHSLGSQTSVLGAESREEKTFSGTPLEKLISLQSFNGSFALDEALCQILGRNLNDLKKRMVLLFWTYIVRI